MCECMAGRCVVHVSVVRSSAGRCIQNRRYGLYVRCCAGCSIRPSVRPRRARSACIHLEKCASRFVRLIPRIIKLHSISHFTAGDCIVFVPAVVWSVNYLFTVSARTDALRIWERERERHRINGEKSLQEDPSRRKEKVRYAFDQVHDIKCCELDLIIVHAEYLTRIDLI